MPLQWGGLLMEYANTFLSTANKNSALYCSTDLSCKFRTLKFWFGCIWFAFNYLKDNESEFNSAIDKTTVVYLWIYIFLIFLIYLSFYTIVFSRYIRIKTFFCWVLLFFVSDTPLCCNYTPEKHFFFVFHFFSNKPIFLFLFFNSLTCHACMIVCVIGLAGDFP